MKRTWEALSINITNMTFIELLHSTIQEYRFFKCAWNIQQYKTHSESMKVNLIKIKKTKIIQTLSSLHKNLEIK